MDPGLSRFLGAERLFSVGDIENVISNGYREPRKDEFKSEHQDWNYAVRGKTLDEEKARVCVAFDKRESVIVITVIRLEGKNDE